ncbi:MAG: M48 family metallopeptidase [Desulfobacterales bacterium]|nr:M48 family metallopeptidase [Desulfobacterales bacterium]
MNSWLLFILAVIILHYLLDVIISVYNIKALSPELPAEFSDVFEQEGYKQSQNYARTTTGFSLIENSISTIVTVIFLLAGGFNLIDLFARSFQLNTILTGVIFTGGLMLLSFVVSLPFSIYSTFKIESQFGFNRTTPLTFITDIIKSVLLTIIIGAPILASILWFFENSGPFAWLYCWLGVIIFGVVLQFLAPVLIMPLFNTFTPLEEGSLSEKITHYAKQENFQIQGIYTMDGSKRSAKLNAFFTGFGTFRKIVFFDTLVEKLSEDEIVAVLAHEMGHYKKKHIWKMMGSSVLQTGLMFFLLSFFIENPGLFEAFSMEALSIYASLFFFAFIYSPLNTLLSILFNYFSRVHEFEADRYAAHSTGKPEMLIQGLKKLSRENLSNLTPHPLMVFFSYSHPPVLERIRTLNGIKT